MSILESVTGKIAEKFKEKYINPQVAEIKSNFEENKIEKEFKALFLKQYGNQPYYESLDRYITVNNLIDSLIDNANETKNQFSKTEFTEKHVTRFIDEYKNKHTITASIISPIFSWMFDFIFYGINFINSHADNGKLLSNILQMESDNAFRETKHHNDVMSRFDDMEKLIREAGLHGIINGVQNDEVIDCSEEVKEFVEEIERIETDYQRKYQFEVALSKYMELLQSIAIKLRGYPNQQTDELICMLYCNIALCHSNLDNKKEAITSLNQIDKKFAETNKRFHFVYASVLSKNEQNYEEALRHLDKALDIDKNYHRAYFFRQYLYALTKKQAHKNNINNMDEYLAVAIKDCKDAEWLSDFYMYRGLVNLAYNEPEEAANDFIKAEENGYNKTITKVNYYAALYQQVASGISKEEIGYSVKFDCLKINTIIAGLKPIIKEDNFNSFNYSTRLSILKLYASACSLLGIDSELLPLSLYIEAYDDYEFRRLLILNSRQEILEKEKQLLNDVDKLYITLRSLINKKPEECKEIIFNRLQNCNIQNPSFVYYFLLQACIATKDSENYWKYRNSLLDNSINEEAVLSMDACMYDAEENIHDAKKIFDKLVGETRDYVILENASRFYKKNDYFAEAENVIIKTCDLYENSEIGIDDVYGFYYGAISFFVYIKSNKAQEFLERIDQRQVTKDEYLKLQVQVFLGTNDLHKLLDCFQQLHQIEKSNQILLNLAICNFQLMKYDDTICACEELLETTSDPDQLLNIYWLLSDSYLLKNDLGNSYLWAEKTHILKKDIPGDRTHQAFFGRAIRCGHFEGMGEMAEYQRVHPVVVNYFKVFQLDPNDDNILESLMKAADEFSPNRGNLEQEEKDFACLYRNNPLTINLLLHHFNGDWQQVFHFSVNNKLKICDGNREKQKKEANMINDALVLDADTLVILSYYEGLSLLSNIKNIYINYSTINTLQHYYMAYGYDYIKDILNWIKESQNIVTEADGYSDRESTISKAFSDNFTKACNVARKKKIPFLCADMYADVLKASTQLEELTNVEFISIPAFYDFIGKKLVKLKEQALYKLIMGATFISFSANTIITALEENDYQSIGECISPFLICKSDYDMDSFSTVYLQAIYHLSEKHEDAACEMAKIILENTRKVWRRGEHYRKFEDVDMDAKRRADSIKKYVVNVVIGINEIIKNQNAEITQMCTNILLDVRNS